NRALTPANRRALDLTGPLNAGSGVATLTSTGTISEQPGGAVTAAMLTGSSAGAASFGQPGNMVGSLGGFATGNGDFTLANGQALNLTGPLNAGSGAATLTSTGTISEQPGGSVTAAMLTGSSAGAASFGQPGNMVGSLGGFATGNGDFTLANGQALNLTGPLNAGSAVAMLTSTGTISEQPGGAVTAA